MEQAFNEAGQFIRQKRKAAGFKTQRALIQALQEADPDVSCSEPYISLIEKGAKTPSVHLLDVIARVLKMSPQEKGELLLAYRRVPSDFEFTVRENLRESLRRTTVDELQNRYQKEPSSKHFNTLLRALVLEDRRQEALELLKQAPANADSFLDLQVRTAHMAGLAGNFDFAIQGFSLVLENCPEEYLQTRGELLMNLGIMYFSKALHCQYSDPLCSLEYLLQAQKFLEQSLAQVPEKRFAQNELARCLYHLGEGLAYIAQQDLQANPEEHPVLSQALKNKAVEQSELSAWSQDYFKQALNTYARLLSEAPGSELPEKPLREAVYFHAYTHGKLKLFQQARVLLNSIILLDRNWLTCFMQAGLELMIYAEQPEPTLLENALYWLKIAFDYDKDAVCWLIRQEKDRELKLLWEQKPHELENLLQQTKSPCISCLAPAPGRQSLTPDGLP